MQDIVHQNTPQYYTYLLINSLTGSVFYVGKGIGNRFYSHEDEARRGIQSAKCDAIRQIWDAGGQIIKTKVGEFDNEPDAFKHEQLLMKQHQDTIVNRVTRLSAPKMGKNLTPFGKYLQFIYRQFDINGLILAKQIGIHQTTISKFSGRGKNTPQRKTILLICQALRTYPEWDDSIEIKMLNIVGYCTEEEQAIAEMHVQDMQFVGSLFAQ